ncbi:MAG: hypothetical protein K2Y31_03560 [Burkholderiales bacterium]|jgi:hypothetical protein|nr:hypothetical protein [Burkholderiales bacterium]
MNVTKPVSPNTTNSPLAENPLDRINLTPAERLRAEGAIRHGEDIAELILGFISTVRSLFGNVKLKPPVDAARRLGPTG